MTSLGTAGDGPGVRRALRFLRQHLRVPLSALSFWFAITLPVIYLSLLVSGIESTEGLLLFLGLIGLHVIALIGGRGHAGTNPE